MAARALQMQASFQALLRHMRTRGLMVSRRSTTATASAKQLRLTGLPRISRTGSISQRSLHIAATLQFNHIDGNVTEQIGSSANGLQPSASDGNANSVDGKDLPLEVMGVTEEDLEGADQQIDTNDAWKIIFAANDGSEQDVFGEYQDPALAAIDASSDQVSDSPSGNLESEHNDFAILHDEPGVYAMDLFEEDTNTFDYLDGFYSSSAPQKKPQEDDLDIHDDSWMDDDDVDGLGSFQEQETALTAAQQDIVEWSRNAPRVPRKLEARLQWKRFLDMKFVELVDRESSQSLQASKVTSSVGDWVPVVTLALLTDTNVDACVNQLITVNEGEVSGRLPSESLSETTVVRLLGSMAITSARQSHALEHEGAWKALVHLLHRYFFLAFGEDGRRLNMSKTEESQHCYQQMHRMEAVLREHKNFPHSLAFALAFMDTSYRKSRPGPEQEELQRMVKQLRPVLLRTIMSSVKQNEKLHAIDYGKLCWFLGKSQVTVEEYPELAPFFRGVLDALRISMEQDRHKRALDRGMKRDKIATMDTEEIAKVYRTTPDQLLRNPQPIAQPEERLSGEINFLRRDLVNVSYGAKKCGAWESSKQVLSQVHRNERKYFFLGSDKWPQIKVVTPSIADRKFWVTANLLEQSTIKVDLGRAEAKKHRDLLNLAKAEPKTKGKQKAIRILKVHKAMQTITRESFQRTVRDALGAFALHSLTMLRELRQDFGLLWEEEQALRQLFDVTQDVDYIAHVEVIRDSMIQIAAEFAATERSVNTTHADSFEATEDKAVEAVEPDDARLPAKQSLAFLVRLTDNSAQALKQWEQQLIRNASPPPNLEPPIVLECDTDASTFADQEAAEDGADSQVDAEMDADADLCSMNFDDIDDHEDDSQSSVDHDAVQTQQIGFVGEAHTPTQDDAALMSPSSTPSISAPSAPSAPSTPSAVTSPISPQPEFQSRVAQQIQQGAVIVEQLAGAALQEWLADKKRIEDEEAQEHQINTTETENWLEYFGAKTVTDQQQSQRPNPDQDGTSKLDEIDATIGQKAPVSEPSSFHVRVESGAGLLQHFRRQVLTLAGSLNLWVPSQGKLLQLLMCLPKRSLANILKEYDISSPSNKNKLDMANLILASGLHYVEIYHLVQKEASLLEPSAHKRFVKASAS
eukprot:m.48390 g.48390  ORF g.48390 m.48390 type:complete len:1147 (+) comp11036_c1_seq1:280-3720(+)